MTQRQSYPLLSERDPPPFETFNENGSAAMLIVADHAGRAIPECLGQLGVADWVLEQHVAWDMGTRKLTMHLARALDAPAVFANYSRLVVDPNRRLDDPTAFPEVSDQIVIPGNAALSEEAREQRAASCYWPYHTEVARLLASLRQRGPLPAVVAIHSCTPVFNDLVRPWHIGVLWNEDNRIAAPLIRRLETVDGLNVGDNEPYSGKHTHSFTLNRHAETAALPHVGIEVRQDLIGTPDAARNWAAILASELHPVLAELGLNPGLRAAV